MSISEAVNTPSAANARAASSISFARVRDASSGIAGSYGPITRRGTGADCDRRRPRPRRSPVEPVGVGDRGDGVLARLVGVQVIVGDLARRPLMREQCVVVVLAARMLRTDGREGGVEVDDALA